MPSNRKVGNEFEEVFARALFDKGCWVHRLTQNAAGQPADIIAVKRDRVFLIDCKVVAGSRFPLTRIEENQRNAMSLFEERTREFGWFAIKLPEGEVRMIPFSQIGLWEMQGRASVTVEDIRKEGSPFTEWIRRIL